MESPRLPRTIEWTTVFRRVNLEIWPHGLAGKTMDDLTSTVRMVEEGPEYVCERFWTLNGQVVSVDKWKPVSDGTIRACEPETSGFIHPPPSWWQQMWTWMFP